MSPRQQDTCRAVFGVYAETDEQLRHCLYLTESIRTYGSSLANAPVWIYTPLDNVKFDDDLVQQLEKAGATIKQSRGDPRVGMYYYAGKVLAAAAAETEASSQADVLIWMDEDTIVLQEPAELILNDSIQFAYRPVMHNRSGSRFDESPDPFWTRIYSVLDLDPTAMQPMITVADQVEIRPYFNAGLLVVRPDAGILGRWAKDFVRLGTDSIIRVMCDGSVNRRIFLHQAALVGAVLNYIDLDATCELPDTYNYPLFFHHQWDSKREFGSIDHITTLRYDVYFRHPEPDWRDQLRGPADKVQWLIEHLGEH